MVAVVADSAANLPRELTDELRIETVPLYLRLGDEELRDGVDLEPAGFYGRLASEGSVASTSTPSPSDFLDAYRRTGERDVVCVTVAASMSGSNHEARLAAERFDGRIEVVDSLSASMSEGFVALAAARAASAGASLEDTAGEARRVAEGTVLFATVSTFDFLRRSGRVTRFQAYAATMLDIKPVFSFRGGEPAALGRPRTRRRALERVAQAALQEIAGRPARVAAVHAVAEAEARALLERIAAEATLIEAHVVPVTPVIGAHTGPGLVGLAVAFDP